MSLFSSPRASTGHPGSSTSRSDVRSSRLVCRTFLFTLLAIVAAPPAASLGQAGPGAGETITAHVRVSPVLRVDPAGPVRVAFGGPGADGWAESRSVEVACAGNVDHALTVRRTDDGPAAVEWTTGGRDRWQALSPDGSVVRPDLQPGRQPSCAEVRFRREVSGGAPQGPVTVEFAVRRR